MSLLKESESALYCANKLSHPLVSTMGVAFDGISKSVPTKIGFSHPISSIFSSTETYWQQDLYRCNLEPGHHSTGTFFTKINFQRRSPSELGQVLTLLFLDLDSNVGTLPTELECLQGPLYIFASINELTGYMLSQLRTLSSLLWFLVFPTSSWRCWSLVNWV